MKVRQLKENLMSAVFFLTALISILAVILICVFLFFNGLPAIGIIGVKNFLLGTEWAPSDLPALYGILPMIVGSLYITVGAILIGLPLGLLTAIFLAFVCPAKFYRILKPAIQLLAGIPSVVYGFFGMIILVPITGTSILTASILLGMMILPTIITLSESALKSVEPLYHEGAMALGCSAYRARFLVTVPAAQSGIFASMVLGIGRAIGETMAVIMVAGNQARMPISVLKGARTLTANIVLEMGYAAELHRSALIATGVVLFVFILIINTSFLLLKGRSK